MAAMILESIDDLKKVLREDDIPFFAENDFEWYVDKCGGDYNRAAYEMLMVKSESTDLSVAGMSTSDSSSYFKRMALRFRPNNSGVLK